MARTKAESVFGGFDGESDFFTSAIHKTTIHQRFEATVQLGNDIRNWLKPNVPRSLNDPRLTQAVPINGRVPLFRGIGAELARKMLTTKRRLAQQLTTIMTESVSVKSVSAQLSYIDTDADGTIVIDRAESRFDHVVSSELIEFVEELYAAVFHVEPGHIYLDSVLRNIIRVNPELSVPEVIHRLGLNQQTAHHLLHATDRVVTHDTARSILMYHPIFSGLADDMARLTNERLRALFANEYVRTAALSNNGHLYGLERDGVFEARDIEIERAASAATVADWHDVCSPVKLPSDGDGPARYDLAAMQHAIENALLVTPAELMRGNDFGRWPMGRCDYRVYRDIAAWIATTYEAITTCDHLPKLDVEARAQLADGLSLIEDTLSDRAKDFCAEYKDKLILTKEVDSQFDITIPNDKLRRLVWLEPQFRARHDAFLRALSVQRPKLVDTIKSSFWCETTTAL